MWRVQFKNGKGKQSFVKIRCVCGTPFIPASLGVVQKAMRSVDPRYAHNSHDAEHRKKRKEKLLRETIDPTTVPLSSIFPGFGFHKRLDPAQETAVIVAEDDLKALAVKIIRGTTRRQSPSKNDQSILDKRACI